MDKTVAVKWMQGFDQKVEAEKDHLSELDGPIGDGDHGANLARGMAAAIEAINTTEPKSAAEVFMVYVWHPVVEAVKQGQLTNDVIDQAVLSTKEVAATKGRASYVGERSIGHIDPGSYSSGLLFKALLEAEG